MSSIRIQNRILVVLTKEEVSMIRDVLGDRVNSIVHTIVDSQHSLTDEESDALNREYAVFSDLKSKFSGGAYVIED